MTDIPILRPSISPLELFRRGLRAGGVATQSFRQGESVFPPRLLAGKAPWPDTHEGLARGGVVVTATRVATRSGSYVLALIDLDGGGRLLARLRLAGEPAEAIDRRASLVAALDDGEPAPTFRLDVGE
jgi:uncharacterized OB-fold protein